MKKIFAAILLFSACSVNAQNKWSFTAETGLTFDQFEVNDGSTWYGRNNGGPYLFNTNSTGFTGGITARYRLKKSFYVESGVYLKSDVVTVNMQFFNKRSFGRQNSWLIPVRFGSLLPLGTSRFYVAPSVGLAVGLPGAEKIISGDFREEPVTFTSRRIHIQQDTLNASGASIYADAGIGGGYRLTPKLSLGLQARYLMRTSGDPEQGIYYGVGHGDGRRFLASQKKKQIITASFVITYQF